MKQFWPNQPVTPSKKQSMSTSYEETNANDTRLSKKMKVYFARSIKMHWSASRLLYLND